MRPREAKDFLVEQIKKQAALDEASLSDLEIQMLYFSEAEDSSDKMQKLSDEFNETYDMATYEKKIATLMQHAYKRLKSDDPQNKEMWESSIRRLRQGDHYILVMWPKSGIIPFAVCLAAVLFLYMLALAARWITHTFAPPNTLLIQVMFIIFVIVCLLRPQTLAKPFGWLTDKIIALFTRPDQKEND